MKNLNITTLFLCLSLSLFAQDQDQEKEKLGWSSEGKFTFLINQSAFSNWIAGGENSVAGNANINYSVNYKSETWSWENRLQASYGLTQNETSDYVKKTDDQLNYYSLVNLTGERKMKWSFLTQFKTQFSDGYNYYDDENGAEQRDVETKFMSPGYLNFGPGLLIDRIKNLSLNVSPATVKMTFVNSEFTSGADYEDGSYFGVASGKSMRFEFGFNAAATYKITLMENVSMENLVNLYSNYLEDPQNIDIDYTMNLVMKINDLLSTNLTFQTIYDDNAFEGFQIREVLGLGLNASF